MITIYNALQTDKPNLPYRYKMPVFWVIRFMLALFAGSLAIGYEITKPLLALNIGAATPLLLQAMTRGIHPPGLEQITQNQDTIKSE